jgi:hypothetical protein
MQVRAVPNPRPSNGTPSGKDCALDLLPPRQRSLEPYVSEVRQKMFGEAKNAIDIHLIDPHVVQRQAVQDVLPDKYRLCGWLGDR